MRHELIPYLESRFNPRVREALARSAALLAEETAFIEARAEEFLAEARNPAPGAVVISCQSLRSAPPAVARAAVRRALEEVGGRRVLAHVHVDRVLALASRPTPSGRRLPLPGGCEAAVSFGDLRLGPKRPAPAAYALPLTVPGRVELPGGLALRLGRRGARRCRRERAPWWPCPPGPWWSARAARGTASPWTEGWSA